LLEYYYYETNQISKVSKIIKRISENIDKNIREIIKGVSKKQVSRISKIIKGVSDNISRLSENIKCIYSE